VLSAKAEQHDLYGGDTIFPLFQLQFPGCQADCPPMPLDTQPGIPLTGPSNETTGVVGNPGYIANASLDPHVDLTVKWQRIKELPEVPHFNNANFVQKMLRKCREATVTSYKARVASEKRRTVSAKFSCYVEGCDSSFTRKHNLTSGLISMHH